ATERIAASSFEPDAPFEKPAGESTSTPASTTLPDARSALSQPMAPASVAALAPSIPFETGVQMESSRTLPPVGTGFSHPSFVQAESRTDQMILSGAMASLSSAPLSSDAVRPSRPGRIPPSQAPAAPLSPAQILGNQPIETNADGAA